MRFPLIVTALILACFIIFQPRIPNYLSASSRMSSLNHLLTATSESNHLDPQKYWETREFYYPGVFYVFQDGLTQAHFDQFSKNTRITLKTESTFPILYYNSPKWQSYEALVSTNNLVDLTTLPLEQPLYQDSETKIYQVDGKTIIYFIKNYDELKITNGFIYTKEAILKKYLYWFGVSVITK